MTAFASRTGSYQSTSWVWELRSVNGRGLDLRLRLPDAIEGLEAQVRKDLSARFTRGNLSLNLRLSREEGDQVYAIDEAALDRALSALDQVQERAFAMGVTLGQPNAADVLSQRGVMTTAINDTDVAGLKAAVLSDFNALADDFTGMRAAEGAALEAVALDQIGQIEDLVGQAKEAVVARADEQKAALKRALLAVKESLGDVDEQRVAQELAVLSVKSDVTEEFDRLNAHIAAARSLLASKEPSGRKLDFLTQEFNREANTLCSKAQSARLTAIGLDLKAVIDQMREQIQNVE